MKCVFIAVDKRIAAYHFSKGKTTAKGPVDQAEREIADTGHGREDDREGK